MVSRINEFVPPIAPTSRSRTEAQKAASRRNGAKSRGPRTPEGKARVANNAVRHGILARRLTPLANGTFDEVDYKHLLAALAEEHAPQTPTEWTLVEILARDFIRLTLICHYQDAVMQTDVLSPTKPPGEAEPDAQDRLALTDKVLAMTKAGRPIKLDRSHLEALAESIHGYAVDVVEEYKYWTVHEPGGDRATEWTLKYQTCRPDIVGATDKARVLAILTGETQLTDECRAYWIRILEYCRDGAEGGCRGARMIYQERRLGDAVMLISRGSLDRLPSVELLWRYEVAARRMIERTIELLESAKSRRS